MKKSKTVKVLHVSISRMEQYRDRVAGRLYIEGEYVADTAENAKYMLPTGKYKVDIVTSKQHHRKMPVVTDSVSRGQMIGFYNSVYGRLASKMINVGTQIAPGYLKLTRDSFDHIYERMRKSAIRGSYIELTISDLT